MQADSPQTEVWGYINQAYKGRLDFIRLQSSLRTYSRDFSRRVFLFHWDTPVDLHLFHRE